MSFRLGKSKKIIGSGGVCLKNWLLAVVGAISTLAGILIILIGTFSVRPRLEKIRGDVVRNLGQIEGLLGNVKNDTTSIGGAVGALSNGSENILRLLPETVLSLRGTIQEGSVALRRVGRTLDSLSSGLSGIVLPDRALGRNAIALDKLADQMRLLEGMIRKAESPLDRLPEDVAVVTNRIKEVSKILPSVSAVAGRGSRELRTIRISIQELPIGLATVGLALFCGALLVLFGIVLFALAALLKRIETVHSTMARGASTGQYGSAA